MTDTTPIPNLLFDLCDGITIIDTRVANAAPKTFSLEMVDEHVPDGCYELYHHDDQEMTSLAFICGEFDEGSTVDVDMASYGNGRENEPYGNELADWERCFPHYAVWADYDGMVKHMKHLAEVAVPANGPAPLKPLTVRII